MSSKFYRVVVMNHGIELSELGVFGSLEDAKRFYQLKRFEIVEGTGDSISIVEYVPKTMSITDIPETVYVLFDSFIRNEDNPDKILFLDSDLRDWILEKVIYQSDEISDLLKDRSITLNPNDAIVFQSSEENIASSFKVLLPVKSQDLLDVPRLNVVQFKQRLLTKAKQLLTDICKQKPKSNYLIVENFLN